MKTLKHIVLLLLAVVILIACSSTGEVRGTSPATDELGITARGAIGRLEAATGPMWRGNGGSNIRLAIVAPEIQGDVPAHLPLYIQGMLNNNFNRFSAINLIDRQHLDRIIAEQNIAASGRFSDQDFVRIGNLTNTQFNLFGTIQRLPGNRFALQLAITESSTGVRRATFMKEGTLAQLEGRATLLNEATAELLAQMGVQLTDAGRQSLLAGNISTVQAQAGLARGITAQAGGSEVEALLNFAQAASFDPSQLEALSRLNTLSASITDGTISQRILNDIQARDRWLEAFRETTRFFSDHPPFEIVFDPNLIQIGETDFARRTATLGMRVALDSSKAGFDALNALLEGLERTGRREIWGFSGWPFVMDNSREARGTAVFGGRRSFSYKVDVALINENGRTIGRSSITLNTDPINFNAGDRIVTPPSSVEGIVMFNNVNATPEILTPTLTIMIVAVNGVSSHNLAATGYMRIETGDFEKRIREREVAEQRAQEQRAQEQRAQEQRARELQQQRERKAAEKRRNASKNFIALSGYYQWSDYAPGIIGAEVNYYFTLIPYITSGIDLRLGFFGEYEYESEDGGSYSSNMTFIISPNIGLVYPLGSNLKVFSNLALEMGMFPPGMKGIITDWATPSLNFGLSFQPFFFKYRLTWYEMNWNEVSSGYEWNGWRWNEYKYKLFKSERIRAHAISIGIKLLT
ncbi:MAG: hypothetical protein FWD87_05355 [Spirochaetaceae bacterium]|nr:hypothetical protein [Spirochaetaceae bacterium]